MAEKPRRISWVGWKPPDVGWIKLNTDGACKEVYAAGCGGILRNNNGEWLGGFAKQLGICSAFMAELWGVLEGLRFAWRMGYRAVELEVDSTSVVKVIRVGATSSAMGVALLEGIGRLLEFEWEVKVTHSYREANTCADALANIGCSLGTDTTFFEECPSQINHLLVANKMGLLASRLIML
jgi:ribonuclease HI